MYIRKNKLPHQNHSVIANIALDEVKKNKHFSLKNNNFKLKY